MHREDGLGGIRMRTTLAVKEELIEQVKALSGVKTKKEAVEIALEEFIKRRKSRKLIDLEGKVDTVKGNMQENLIDGSGHIIYILGLEVVDGSFGWVGDGG